jgi:hypothetical protein
MFDQQAIRSLNAHNGLKKISLYILVLVLLFSFRSDHRFDGREILQEIYSRYHGKWYHNLQYTQDVNFFKKGKNNGTQRWYESILFPNVLRIDYINPKKRNIDIITRDTMWEFRKGLLRNIIPGMGDGVFLSGGLYFYSLEEDEQKLKDMGINLDKFYKRNWKNSPVYVLGADNENSRENQIWFDAGNLYIVRLLTFFGSTIQDQVLVGQVQLKGGWSEKKTSIYINDTLVLVQTNSDLVPDAPVNPADFDPGQILVNKPVQ